MPAPSITHPYISAAFSGVDTVQVLFTGAVSSGDTLISGVSQTGSIRRGITAWTDNKGQTHTAIGSGVTQNSAHTEAVRYKANTAALIAGDSMSVTFDGTTEGRLHALAIGPSTYGSLQDSNTNATSVTSHQCAATGFTTAANVFVVGVATLNGGGGEITPGDSYIQQGASNQELFFTKASDSALGSTQVGPYTTEIARGDTGVLAAFSAAAGGGGGSIVINLNIG